MSNAKATGADSVITTLAGLVMIVGYFYTDIWFDPLGDFYGDAGHVLLGILCSLIAYAKNRNPVIWFAWGMWFVIISLIVLIFFKKLSDTECPFCKEGIKTKAIICPHCQTDLQDKALLERSAEKNKIKPLSKNESTLFITIFVILVATGFLMFYDFGSATNELENPTIKTEVVNTGNKLEQEVKATSVKSSETDKWWERTDKYAICYGNVTKAHKASGLYDRNRRLSVQIKEDICKIAATSTTGEGCYWIDDCP